MRGILHLFTLLWIVSATAQSIPDYDLDFIGAPLADPVMQHNKETYVLYGCAYCHGMNLKPVGEATDLRTSAIVGTDVDANLIGAILRVGIPQTPKSSPMPQFSDLSDQEIRAIASYIHYMRAQENFKLLTSEPATSGNAALGKSFFEKSCSSCHSVTKDFDGIGRKYNKAELRELVLEPAGFRSPRSYKADVNNSRLNLGRAKHQALLENYKKEDVSNLVTYLQTLE